MFDFHTLAELSRIHCISICAFLVPANLLCTSLTMLLSALRRPPARVWQAAGIASIPALVMLYHVYTWFMVGVVLAPTYILLWLGTSCLFTNIGAVVYNYNTTRLQTQVSSAPANNQITTTVSLKLY